MPTEDNDQITQIEDPVATSRGSASRLDSDRFGTLEASRIRDRQRTDVNRQIHLNRKKETAVRRGYRNLLRNGRPEQAFQLLQQAEQAGVNPFGIRMSGDDARAAGETVNQRIGALNRAAGEAPAGQVAPRDANNQRDPLQEELRPVEPRPEGLPLGDPRLRRFPGETDVEPDNGFSQVTDAVNDLISRGPTSSSRPRQEPLVRSASPTDFLKNGGMNSLLGSLVTRTEKASAEARERINRALQGIFG